MAIQNISGALDPQATYTARGTQSRTKQPDAGGLERQPLSPGRPVLRDFQPESAALSQQQTAAGVAPAELPTSVDFSESIALQDSGAREQTPRTGALEDIAADIGSEQDVEFSETAFDQTQASAERRGTFAVQEPERTQTSRSDTGIQRTARAQIRQQTEVNALSAQRTNYAPAAGLNIRSTALPEAIGHQIDTLA